ncbi:helix-turn-helix transcriptional regulator [Pseudomonas monsensis]|uniref:helix-turn-helix transcriptional regulator n=1 Tax=Pseudomonas monsensis TaxID=2745509 RepID=UPI003D19BF63
MEQQRTTLIDNVEASKMIGMKSVSGLSKLRERDKTFPKPITTSDARCARLRFDPAEIEQWIANKKAARDQQGAANP